MRILHTKTQALNPAIAKKYATMTPVPRERPLNPQRVRDLMADIQAKKTIVFQWAAAQVSGELYRVNGQHTSHLFHQNPKLIHSGMRVNVTVYECKSMEEVAELYSKFDSGVSSRNAGDVNRVYAGTVESLLDMPTWLINLCTTGLAYAKWGEKYMAKRREERAELLLENEDFILFVQELSKTRGSGGFKCMKKGAVVAAIYETYQISEDISRQFWSAVRDATGPTPDSPDRMLNTFLLTCALNSGAALAANKSAASRREIYAKCILAWNAFRKNEITRLRYSPTKPLPSPV